MSALLAASWLVAAEPVTACYTDSAVLTTVLEGVEVGLGAEIVLAQLGEKRVDEQTAPRVVVAQGTFSREDGVQVPFDLRLGAAWTLDRAGEQLSLTVPRLIRSPVSATILGVVGRQIWLAAPGVVARLDVATGAFETARVGARSENPLPLAVDETTLLAAGHDLLECAAPNRCARRARLAAPAYQVVPGPGGWLLATRGRRGALYRVSERQVAALTPLVKGDVVALCDAGGGTAWSVVAREGEVLVVAAATDLPMARVFSAREVLCKGVLLAQDPEVIDHIFKLATREQWSGLTALALRAAASNREILRQQAAMALATVPGARATAALWLLGHDESVAVRLEALSATAARCAADPDVGCAHALSMFLADAETEVAWSARDRLLEVDPRIALEGAPSPYKLEAIAALVGRLHRNGDLAAERALEMLATDSESEVRAAARMALAGAHR